MNRKRKPNPYPNEQPTDLTFWFRDGSCVGCDARLKANTRVSVGRTDSKRALGFVVRRGEASLDFVLDKDQVAELATYLKHVALKLLRSPLGRKQGGLSLVAMHTPKRLLFMELEAAAQKAHPEYHEVDLGDGCFEVKGPEGEALVAWFKKNRPKEAARIERAFTKKLWAG